MQIGRAALEEYNAGHWLEAYRALRSAERLAHSPVFELFMARCQHKLGLPMAARELYRAVANESLASDAPVAFRDALNDARTELGEVSSAVPSVRLSLLSREKPPARQVLIDGVAIDAARWSAPIELEVGQHRIEARSASGQASASVTLESSQHEVPVVLELSPTRNAATGEGVSRALASAPEGATRATAPTASGSASWPVLAGLSVGAAGVLLGTACGLLAWSQMHDLRARCGGGVCPSTERPTRDSARRLANVSTAAFVVGGVGLGAGLALSLIRPSSSESARHEALSGGLLLSGEL